MAMYRIILNNIDAGSLSHRTTRHRLVYISCASLWTAGICRLSSNDIAKRGEVRELKDTDLMPFGKFKDMPMSDVPASYLHWLWTQAGKERDKVCPVADYIRRNISALKQEYKDGIW